MSNNLFRRTCALTAFALTLIGAPCAQADPTFHTTGYAVGAQQFGLSMGGSPNAGAFKGTWGGDPIIFWCIELDQYFSFGQDYTYKASLPNNALFSLLGKLFTETQGSELSDTKHSAAFQLAIWEIVYDSGNLKLDSGSFKVTNDYLHPETVELAQEWLDGLAGGKDKYDVYLLSNDAHQNFITTHQVTPPPPPAELPEPPVLALLGIALGAGWFARRGKAVVHA